MQSTFLMVSISHGNINPTVLNITISYSTFSLALSFSGQGMGSICVSCSLPYALLGTSVSYRKPIQEEATSKRVEVDPLLGHWWTKIEPATGARADLRQRTPQEQIRGVTAE